MVEPFRTNLNTDVKIRSIIISAFPGTGKSFAFGKLNGLATDSDSSKFDKAHFPENYINHIKECIGKYKYIFVSSHKEVRNALHMANLPYVVVIPNRALKNDYLHNYKLRGNDGKFISLINKNWRNWITDIYDNEKHKIVLGKNEYILNILKELEWMNYM